MTAERLCPETQRIPDCLWRSHGRQRKDLENDKFVFFFSIGTKKSTSTETLTEPWWLKI